MRYVLACLVALLPGVLPAQEWAVLAGDTVLTRSEVEAATVGRTLVYHDDGRSQYSAGGAYSYTYAQGGTAFGVFDLQQDGTVCVSFRNGFSRCDRFVRNAGRLILLTQKGQRFPVRP